jgi:hypothetical protein
LAGVHFKEGETTTHQVQVSNFASMDTEEAHRDRLQQLFTRIARGSDGIGSDILNW